MLLIHQRCASDVRTDFLECTGRLEMRKVRNPGTIQRVDLLLGDSLTKQSCRGIIKRHNSLGKEDIVR